MLTVKMRLSHGSRASITYDILAGMGLLKSSSPLLSHGSDGEGPGCSQSKYLNSRLMKSGVVLEDVVNVANATTANMTR